MELLILGSGTGDANPRRAACSALLQVNGSNLLFDFGPAIRHRMLEEGLEPTVIDAIFLTHFHVDHTLDLWTYLFAAIYAESWRPEPVILIAEQSFERLHGALIQAYGKQLAADKTIMKKILLNRTGPLPSFEPEGLPEITVTAGPTLHKPESLAFKIETDSRSFVYSGDTGWSEELIRLARGVDCLVLEATRPDDRPKDNHLTPSQAGKLATQAGVGTLILTHLSPKHGSTDPAASAAQEFSGRVLTAEDGLRITV